MTPTQRKHLRTGARNITKAVLLATLVTGSDKGSFYSRIKKICIALGVELSINL